MKIDCDWIGSWLVVKLDLQLNIQVGFKLNVMSLLIFCKSVPIRSQLQNPRNLNHPVQHLQHKLYNIAIFKLFL